VIIAIVCAASVATAAPSLEQECNAAKGKPLVAPKDKPLAIKLTKSSDPVRSIVIRRNVQCGYKNNKFVRALESIWLELATGERGEVQFDTKNPTQTRDYYVECTVGLPALTKLVKGAKAAPGISCVHRIHRKDGGEADRVTGVSSFKNGPGTIEVTARNGWNITLRLTGEAQNQFETVHVDVEGSGAMTNTVQVFGCPTKPTKQYVPPPCG